MNKEEVIEYPSYKFKYGERLFPTTVVDYNKVTKRIVYGDTYFGKPEKNMYGHVAYNGNLTIGVINKLNSGWLERKANYWKEYLDKYQILKKKSLREYDRISKLYEEYLNWKKGNPSIYGINLNSKQQILRIYLRYLKEYDLPDTIKIECIIETFNEKFGIEPVSEFIDVKEFGVTKEIIEL